MLFLLICSLLIGCSQNVSDFQEKERRGKKGDFDEKEETDSILASRVNYFIFGRFCGECSFECAPMFRFNSDGHAMTLQADYEDNYFEDKLIFKNQIPDLNKKRIANELLDKIPTSLLNHKGNKKRFGCPDCNDGCDVYLEISQSQGLVKIFWLDLMEHEDLPKDVQEYTIMVDDAINRILE